MNRRNLLLFALAAALIGGAASRPAGAQTSGRFEFRDGDRVVFLGDSITQQRLYTTYIESYLLTRYPGRKFTFRNSGWGGDTAWLRQRTQGTDMTDAKLFMLQGAEQEAALVRMVTHGLTRDVLPLRPSVVLIDFGMNDARRGEAALPVYVRSHAELAAQLRKAGARPVILTASPEERSQEGQPGGSAYNVMLEKYSAALKELAEREKLPFSDQFHPYVDLINRARKQDAAFKSMPDGVHPFPSGHLVMAWGILKGLQADPVVSEVTITAGNRPRARATNAEVRDLKLQDGVLSFTRADHALPMPLPAEAPAVLSYAPILDDLSRYTLKVTGLKSERYDVLIGGHKAATIGRPELEAGWNMSAAPTPPSGQAGELMQKVIAKNNVFFERWRQVLVPAIVAGKAGDPDVKAKLDDADRRIAALEAEIEALRAPKPQSFELRPAQ